MVASSATLHHQHQRAPIDDVHQADVNHPRNISQDRLGGSRRSSAEEPFENGHKDTGKTASIADEEDDWDRGWGEDDDDPADDAGILDEDPEDMAQWTGEASIKGSSEAVRMMLLTFNSIGLT